MMKNTVEFCTCSDRNCPNNPVNHEAGCTPCIEKNLACGEIPSCFFNALGKPKKGTGYSYEAFAHTVLDE